MQAKLTLRIKEDNGGSGSVSLFGSAFEVETTDPQKVGESVTRKLLEIQGIGREAAPALQESKLKDADFR